MKDEKHRKKESLKFTWKKRVMNENEIQNTFKKFHNRSALSKAVTQNGTQKAELKKLSIFHHIIAKTTFSMQEFCVRTTKSKQQIHF